MNHFVFYRMAGRHFAPLREGSAEGATASELLQDKSDSLRLRSAVVMVLLVNTFAQPAHSGRSLSISTSRYTDSTIFTSPASQHVS